MEDLRTLLVEYKNAAVGIGVCLEIEDYDTMDILIVKREEIIRKIEALSYDRDEFQKICSEIQIPMIEGNIGDLMNKKGAELREKVAKVSAGKNINAGYYKRPPVDPMILNKKI